MRPLAKLVAPLAVVLSACTGSGSADHVSYTDPAGLSYLSLPADWHLYELEELKTLDELPFVESVGGIELPPESGVAFDGAPIRDVANLASDLATADYPIGSATIRAIDEQERDFVSRFMLTQSVVPYRSLGDPQEVMKEDFSFGNGYEGVRVLVAFTAEDGTSQGVAYMISVTDAEDERMYSVVAGCSLACFTRHQDRIEEVVDSWLVNTKA